MEHLPRRVPGPQYNIIDLILEAIFGPIGDGINDFINDLLGLLSWIPGVGGGLTALADGLNETHETATNAESTATQAQLDAESAAALAAANEASLVASTASTTLTLATKADINAIPHNVPSWFSLNPLEDVSFPRSEITESIGTITVTAQTGSEVGYSSGIPATGAIFNPNGFATINATAQARTFIFGSDGGAYTPASGSLQIAYINATRDRIYNTVGFATGPGSVGTPAAIYVGIFKMDLTAGVPNGNLTRLFASTNQSSQVTSASQDVRVNLGSDIVAAQGDWFAVAILQVQGGGQTLRSLACKRGIGVNVPAGYNPAKPVMMLSGQSSIPSTIAKASLDTSSVITPWACLGQQTAISKADYTDLFDRSDSNVLGSNWAPYGYPVGVKSNAAQIPSLPNPGAFTARVETGSAIYTSQLTSDSQAVIATFGAHPTATEFYTPPEPTVIVLRSNNTMTSYVGAALTGTDIKIVTPSSTLASVSNTNNANDVVEIHCAANVFTVYVNGVPKLTYTDTGNVLPLGSSYRFCGFVMQTWAYGGDFSHSQEYHQTARILQWEAKDL